VLVNINKEFRRHYVDKQFNVTVVKEGLGSKGDAVTKVSTRKMLLTQIGMEKSISKTTDI
jgi:hypothetical protein